MLPVLFLFALFIARVFADNPARETEAAIAAFIGSSLIQWAMHKQ